MTSITTFTGLAGSGATSSTGAKPADEKAQMLKTAKAFEAIFLRQMIGEMRSSTLADDDVLGSSATGQFRELGDAKMADNLSEKGAFGIAALLLKQLEKPTATAAAMPAASTDNKA